MKKFIFLMLFPIIASAHNITGGISFYGDEEHGKLTARGDIYNQWALTAAHKTLPFGTILEVTNLANGKSVTVKITDRGPYVKGRVLDLSTAAFLKIASRKQGVINANKVSIRIIKMGAGKTCHHGKGKCE